MTTPVPGAGRSTDPPWAKSSHSGGEGGQCLEWAPGPAPDLVRLRDGKAPEGPHLVLPVRAFAGLVAWVGTYGPAERSDTPRMVIQELR
ncbi:DUF397 domain-containing protein [Streptomyces sp. NPDC049906]|uniref:DUF397 domain-containing protein n=1 Tax=Streptomyces sp. NPDC049906 TaxID=3155656 RepID=UPI0034453F99